MSRTRLPFFVLALAATTFSIAESTNWTPAVSQVPLALSATPNDKSDVLRTVAALAMLAKADFQKKAVIERVTNTRLQKFGVSPPTKDSSITQVRLQTADDGSKRITGLWLTVNSTLRISRDDVLQALSNLQSQFKSGNSNPFGDIVSGGESRVYFRRGAQQIEFEFDPKDADVLRFVVFSDLERKVESQADDNSSRKDAFSVTSREPQKNAPASSKIASGAKTAAPTHGISTPAASAAKPAPASDKVAPLTGHFTCDNSYQVWVGNGNEVHTLLLEATNMKTVNIAQGEDLPPTTPEPGQYLYIVAWSDDYIYQGLIGAFKGDITILSGDSRWKVLPTGRNKNNKQFPTMKEINNAMEDGADNWRDPTFGATNGGPPWNFPIAGIPGDARWMWYDSNKDRKEKYPNPPYVPFGSGFNHDEFLIFRIPYQDFYSEQLAIAIDGQFASQPHLSRTD